MYYLATIAVFAILMGVAYRFAGRTSSARQIAALVVAFAAAWPMIEGGFALEREVARHERGRIDVGVVIRKLSSTGEAGTTTIGRSYRGWRKMPTVNTINGFRYYDVLSRWVLAGSPSAWVVDYRYPCGSSGGCFGRDFVGYDLWSRLEVGQTVNVRSVQGRVGSGRLSANRVWPTAALTFGFGALLGFIAYVVSGAVKPRRQYLTAPAVVTSVESIASGEHLRWRVKFAYFTADGRTCESMDEIYVPGLKAGDDCTVLYPRDQPELGTLQTAA